MNIYRALFVDYFTVMLPSVLFVTLLADQLWASYQILLTLCAIVCCLIFAHTSGADRLQTHDSAKIKQMQHQQQAAPAAAYPDDNSNLSMQIVKLSVHWYRTSVVVVTSIAILAVDFGAVFAPRHTKRRDFGLALMDLGVGSFIVCHSMRLIRNCDDADAGKDHLPYFKYTALLTKNLVRK